jgi:hypothetical protein
MSTNRYTCCDHNRRAAVDAHATLNGIDWLEVLDRDAPTEATRQRTLLVRLLKPVPAGVAVGNVRITGGERIRHIDIEWVGVADAPPPQATPAEQALFAALPEPDRVLLVRTDMAGDFSTYRLSLAQGGGSELPLADFDPRLSAVDFAFKVECPSDFDCAPVRDCPPEPRPDPDLNYLARDYASLRRLLVDRLSQQMPGWRDRSPADLTTTLAELIAYMGDLKHYQLDAITTEAYLHSARRRTSLRRHALLVDYPMHEGCNARTWVHLEVNGAPFDLSAGVRFLTRSTALPVGIAPDSDDERAARRAGALVFESMHGLRLRAAHNAFGFHTWGDTRCCLPKGATRATLRGHWPDLAVGDVLIFEEVLGPRSGAPEDADPAHRHAVRLTGVQAFMPGAAEGAPPTPLTDPLPDADSGQIHPITEIRWHADDALPFPLCLSAETDAAHGSVLVEGVSLALGNNMLADHGEYLADEALGSVPAARLHYPATGTDACQRSAVQPLPPRYAPALAEGPVTHQGMVVRQRVEDGLARSERVPFDPDASATSALRWRTADALPRITLQSSLDGLDEPWEPRRDLLDSEATDRHFVLETEHDGHSRIRFGDDTHGRRPDAGTAFTARYRIGNGPVGNVGADSIRHALTLEARIVNLRNPLPASGGQRPESAEQVRRRTPHAFRTQERAVTPADYAEVTERLDGVQRAAATLRWTGSWHTVFTTVDRQDGAPVTPEFADTVVTHLDRYRMAGHDLRVTEPIHVSLEIDMLVCVQPDYFRSHVHEGLLRVFSRLEQADGTRGVFHPDNFSFGQTVFLSPLYAAARTVAGVASVQVTRFHRQGQADPAPLAQGFMRLGRLEIARLDNDPNFPEHGVLRLSLHGGK